jgi:hypothetical protein
MKRAAERSETRSKWSRLMRYAVAYKPNSQPLEQFVRRKGGINACAARFTRWLERSAGLFNSLYMKCNERRASRPPRVMR